MGRPRCGPATAAWRAAGGRRFRFAASLLLVGPFPLARSCASSSRVFMYKSKLTETDTAYFHLFFRGFIQSLQRLTHIDHLYIDRHHTSDVIARELHALALLPSSDLIEDGSIQALLLPK